MAVILARAVNITYVVLLFLSALLGTIFMIFPLIPVFIFVPRWWRLCVDRIVGFWLTFPSAMLEVMHGLKVYQSSRSPFLVPSERSLIIMNHRTRLDWLYLWPLLYRHNVGFVNSEKIILKSDLKKIPGAGWAMECDAFVFLFRDWARDRGVLADVAAFYASIQKPYQILIFPEGTDMSGMAKQRSDAYAKKNDLPTYNFVLHPRTTGFVFLAQELRRQNYLEAIYDISIGYPDDMAVTEVDFMSGWNAKSICIDIVKYDESALPASDAGMTQWCNDRWAEKEALLEQFHQSGDDIGRPGLRYNSIRYDGGISGGLGRSSVASPVAVKDPVSDIHDQNPSPVSPVPRRFPGSKLLDLTTGQRLLLWFSFTYWTFGSLAWLYLIYAYFWVKTYVAAALVTFVFISIRFGGVELLEILRWKKAAIETNE